VQPCRESQVFFFQGGRLINGGNFLVLGTSFFLSWGKRAGVSLSEVYYRTFYLGVKFPLFPWLRPSRTLCLPSSGLGVVGFLCLHLESAEALLCPSACGGGFDFLAPVNEVLFFF